MRSIGSLHTATDASTFGDYLYSKGIESQIEQEEDGTYPVWILEDEQIPAASDLLKQYLANPGADEFKNVSKAAQKKRAREEKAASRKRSEVASEERVLYEKYAQYLPAFTVTLIVISVAVTLYSSFGKNPLVTQYLYFEPDLIFSGQAWRAVSPIFLHLSLYHIVFNMFWLFDLGGMIERKLGKLYFGMLVLVIAVLSCWTQFWWHGPYFGGMSGVVYGLFGFIWIRSKFDRVPVFSINQNSVTIMLGWLVLCMTNLMGPVANAAHVSGLVVGMAWAFVTRVRFRN